MLELSRLGPRPCSHFTLRFLLGWPHPFPWFTSPLDPDGSQMCHSWPDLSCDLYITVIYTHTINHASVILWCLRGSFLFCPICSCSRASGLSTGTCIHPVAQTGSLKDHSEFYPLPEMPTPQQNASPLPVISISLIYSESFSLFYLCCHNLEQARTVSAPDPANGLLTSMVAFQLSVHAVIRKILK